MRRRSEAAHGARPADERAKQPDDLIEPRVDVVRESR